MNMTSKVLLGIVITAAALGGTAEAQQFTKDNTIVINDVITRDSMTPLYKVMDDYLAADPAEPLLNIIIDSPGGSVYAGFQFITQMKALKDKGTAIVCYVPGLAASMAFQILTQCDKRIVVQESALLWHRARVMGSNQPITAITALNLGRDLAMTDQHILDQLVPTLVKDMDIKDIMYHFEQETMHIGQSLCKAAPHFCVARTAVPGLMQALRDKDIPHSVQRVSIFDQLKKKESFVYIYPKFLENLLKEEGK